MVKRNLHPARGTVRRRDPIGQQTVGRFGNENWKAPRKTRLDPALWFKPIENGPFHFQRQPQIGHHFSRPGTRSDYQALSLILTAGRPDAHAAIPGFPAEEILGVAKDADMIVLGSRGAGGFKKLLMGSVASQVTRHAHVPVVVIPAENS